MNKFKLLLLPGDGIGNDIMFSILPIFKKININFDIKFGNIGWECWKTTGNPIPPKTWELIHWADSILLGATTSKPENEALNELQTKNKTFQYISPIIQLRQQLNLFANVRPIFSIKNNKTQKNNNIDITIIRENTEGLYSGLDFYPLPKELLTFIKNNKNKNQPWTLDDIMDGAVSLRIITQHGIERILRFAFNWAKEHNYNLITLADKPNVTRKSGQFICNILEKVSSDYPNINYEIKNVDAIAMWLIKDPSKFQVIVSENQFGDILSDLGAGIMGGLGLAPSGNIGKLKSYFEPVHGSAPKYKNKNIVNPSAMFFSLAMLLYHHGYKKEAIKINNAVKQVIYEQKYLTYDLGGKTSTLDMSKAIIDKY